MVRWCTRMQPTSNVKLDRTATSHSRIRISHHSLGRRGRAMSQSRDNFVRLAEARTTRVLKDLDLLGNLSNRSNYSYSEEDVKKVFRAIQRKIKDTEARFRTTLQQRRPSDLSFETMANEMRA